MKKDAEIHAEEDRNKKEIAEVKNHADTLVYTAEKALRETGDKISDDIKKDIEEKIESLKKAKEGTDTEAIKNASASLSASLQKIGEALYKQSDNDKKQEKSDNVKEAEYEEKKDEE